MRAVKMSFSAKRVSLHIIFWLVYIFLNAVLTSIFAKQPLPENLMKAMTAEVYSLPAKMALVYFVFYYIIPLYLDRSKVRILVALTLSGFILTAAVYRLILGWIYYPIFNPMVPFYILNPTGWLLTMFDLFITLAAATTIKMVRVHYASIEFEQELIREKLWSELSFLRAQTNPHFLFNTLNNLYALSRKKSDKTPDAIMMLSKIMRFMLYDCRAPQILLSDEIMVIRDYIELEKLRFSNRLSVELHEKTDDPEAMIAPLLLLPFVENSFKHGAGSTTGKAHIRIDIVLKDKELRFSVRNTMDSQANPAIEKGGIGLKNVQRQLELLYSDRYSLQAGHSGDQFTVELTLTLDEKSPAN